MNEHRRYKGIDHRLADHRQRDREAMLIAQDRADERIEQLRQQAEADALEGKVANLQDTVVAPTPEWTRKGETVPYTPRGRDGTVKAVKTVRRRLFDAVTHLEGRGAITTDQAKACRWFRNLHETAQVDRAAGVASYGESIRGDVLYGHLPVSERAARARQAYRGAQQRLPVGSSAPFEAVVIRNLPLERAGRTVRKHKSHVLQQVRNAADAVSSFMADHARASENAR